jgi:hypothetical protein
MTVMSCQLLTAFVTGHLPVAFLESFYVTIAKYFTLPSTSHFFKHPAEEKMH